MAGLKIEVTFLQLTDDLEFGGELYDIRYIIIRVPRSIKVIDRKSIIQEMNNRTIRKEIINRWRTKLGKSKIKTYNNCYYLGWSPLIGRDKLELIQKYL